MARVANLFTNLVGQRIVAVPSGEVHVNRDLDAFKGIYEIHTVSMREGEPYFHAVTTNRRRSDVRDGTHALNGFVHNIGTLYRLVESQS